LKLPLKAIIKIDFSAGGSNTLKSVAATTRLRVRCLPRQFNVFAQFPLLNHDLVHRDRGRSSAEEQSFRPTISLTAISWTTLFPNGPLHRNFGLLLSPPASPKRIQNLRNRSKNSEPMKQHAI
jgi:hypothetical protein